jgi:type I restriction enzyme, S subunit
MSESKKLIPRRRFREFEKSKEFCQVEWHKLVERLTVMSSAHCLPRVEFEDIISGQGELNKDVFKKINDKKGVEFKKGDILFGKLRPYLKNWLYAGFDGIAVGDFWVFRPTFSNGEFIYALIQTNQYQIVANQSTGTKMPRSDWNIVSNTKFIVTTNKIEQTQIGEFFKKFDNLINTQQKKLEKAKILKSAYLREMFPNEGELKPRLRFNRFIEDWKPIKLGEAGSTTSGIGFPDNEQGGEHGIPFYKVSDMNNIGNEIEMKLANNYVTSEQISNRKWNPITTIPAIIFAKVGAAIMLNRKRLVRTEFLIDNNMMAYVFDNKWDINFGKVLFETINLAHYSQVGALPSYNSSDIEKIDITFPNTAEQTKIGNFFKLLDDKIALEQKKLDKLKNIKQAYLNEMFV